jgi:sugar phosphate isomerase/epimerase
MSSIQFSYSTFGLTDLTIIEAIHAVADAGYAGIELAFHKNNFNPFEINHDLLDEVKSTLKARSIEPACISAPTHFFMDTRPHEPSLMCTDIAGRKLRIDLIKRAIRVAQYVGAPLVCFGSGFIREEHVKNPDINPRQLLIDGIKECLQTCKDVTLVIEPEPGMYIETIDDGVNLINEINDDKFRLHLDLNHVSCGNFDFVEKMAAAAPLAKYLHISDTVDGYNLKMSTIDEDVERDMRHANQLIYFPETADYLLLDQKRSLYFHDSALTGEQQSRIEKVAANYNSGIAVEHVDYNALVNSPSSYDPEIDVYGFSIQRMSFYVVDRAKPILRYIREQGIADKMVANTLTGKVHFHEIPGKGEIDFRKCFSILIDNGYRGFGSVELYHHVDRWQQALSESLSYLSQQLPAKKTDAVQA